MHNYEHLKSNWKIPQFLVYSGNLLGRTLTVVTISKPGSSWLLMAMPGIDSSSISATSSCGRTSGSGTSSVSRRKLVTFENPPQVAVYGSLMNFYGQKNRYIMEQRDIGKTSLPQAILINNAQKLLS